MRTPSNTYLPLTLAANETRVIVIEDVAARLPLYDGVLILRSIEPITVLPVTLDSVITVTGAAIGFNGVWENRIVDTTLPASGFLRIQLLASADDGAVLRHRLTITNPTGVAVTLHALINGSVEVGNPPPTPTYVVVP